MILAEINGKLELLSNSFYKLMKSRNPENLSLIGNLSCDYPSLKKLSISSRSPEDFKYYLIEKIREQENNLKELRNQLNNFDKEVGGLM